MAFRSLRSRLLFVQSALVVGLTAATLAYVSVLANRAVGKRIADDLARSRRTIEAVEADRGRALQLLAELVASFPNLRALFTTDGATVRDFLSEFRQSHHREELLIAIDAAGRVVARSDTFAPLAIPNVKVDWLAPALGGREVLRDLAIDGRLFRAALAPAEVGGTVFGFVLAAAPLDDAWARALRDASDKEIVILSETGPIGSTLPRERIPWTSSQAAGATLSPDLGPFDVTLNDERFQAIAVPGLPGSTVRVVSLQSRDLALAPYRSIQFGLLLLGVIAAAAGVAGSAVFARSLTQPIGQLVEATRHVAEGRYDRPIALVRPDEIGDLAASFNLMTAGLRERADMQKFVSHSTVEMIQRHRPGAELGARRTITLLFCDIRGFTAFAGQHPPEEAVRVLNRYLLLQADLVARHHGDVDKFMGDAVFAHFYGPDMALDAIRCGVEIQRAVRQASVADPALPALAVGIGIATGEVIVGSIGSADRLDYTAVGPAVNLASRLCSAAEAHEILLSGETFALVRDLVAAEPVPPLVVKGFSEPVRAYRMKRSE
jgi:class 3 adenylate cyclase